VATAFEIFVNTELPQRAVMLTDLNTGGYVGNPNSAVLDKIKYAPKGTWFIDATSGNLWQKLEQTDPSSWVNRSTGGGGVERYYNQALTGDIDGTNLVFTTSVKFVHATSTHTESLYWNGVKLKHGSGYDYVASESVGGSGYDTITMALAPVTGDTLLIDITPL
jgi:hypothetical protein